MSKYKSFTKLNKDDEKFDYDTDILEENGYEFKGRFNKTNPEFKSYCKDFKNQGRKIKIIKLKQMKNEVHLWVRNNQNLVRD